MGRPFLHLVGREDLTMSGETVAGELHLSLVHEEKQLFETQKHTEPQEFGESGGVEVADKRANGDGFSGTSSR
jgi:hypothetical protein